MLPALLLLLWFFPALFGPAAAAPASTAVSNAPPASALSAFDEAHLVDQHGAPVSGRTLQGRLVLLNFIFTSCDTTCPMQTEQLARVQRQLPAELRERLLIVSVSVDPAKDTPAALRAYASSFRVDGKHWLFVTGNSGDAGRLAQHFDSFAPGSGGPQAGRHTTDIRLFDTQGHLLQRYAGAPVDEDRLQRELQQIAEHTAPRR